MKNLSIIIASIALMCSCAKKKDWNCQCDISGTMSNNGTHNKTITQQTSSQANQQCTDYGKALINGNGAYKCKITEL